MTSIVSKLLLDTNVWMDSYFKSRSGNATAKSLINGAARKSVSLFHTVTIEADVFFLVAAKHKELSRLEGPLTEQQIAAAREMAWACTEHMERLSTPIGQDLFDLRLAHGFRFAHNDLEDNLVLAAAKRAGVDAVVTSDKRLIAHATAVAVPALTPQQALDLINALP